MIHPPRPPKVLGLQRRRTFFSGHFDVARSKWPCVSVKSLFFKKAQVMDSTDILELCSPPISTVTKILPTHLMCVWQVWMLVYMFGRSVCLAAVCVWHVCLCVSGRCGCWCLWCVCVWQVWMLVFVVCVCLAGVDVGVCNSVV